MIDWQKGLEKYSILRITKTRLGGQNKIVDFNVLYAATYCDNLTHAFIACHCRERRQDWIRALDHVDIRGVYWSKQHFHQNFVVLQI